MLSRGCRPASRWGSVWPRPAVKCGEFHTELPVSTSVEKLEAQGTQGRSARRPSGWAAIRLSGPQEAASTSPALLPPTGACHSLLTCPCGPVSLSPGLEKGSEARPRERQHVGLGSSSGLGKGAVRDGLGTGTQSRGGGCGRLGASSAKGHRGQRQEDRSGRGARPAPRPQRAVGLMGRGE